MLKQTTETETAVEISPELRQRLRSSVQQILGLKESFDAAISAERAELQALLEEAEIKSFDDPEIGAAQLVSGGTSAKFNKKKLMAAYGITPAQIEACTDRKPKKPYLVVRKPGAQDEDDE